MFLGYRAKHSIDVQVFPSPLPQREDPRKQYFVQPYRCRVSRTVLPIIGHVPQFIGDLVGKSWHQGVTAVKRNSCWRKCRGEDDIFVRAQYCLRRPGSWLGTVYYGKCHNSRYETDIVVRVQVFFFIYTRFMRHGFDQEMLRTAFPRRPGTGKSPDIRCAIMLSICNNHNKTLTGPTDFYSLPGADRQLIPLHARISFEGQTCTSAGFQQQTELFSIW